MVNVTPYPGTPRWVKVFGIIAVVLTLLVLFLILAGVGGPHGPGHHTSSGEAGRHIGWGRLMLLGVLVVSSVALNWGWLADMGAITPRPGRFSISRRWPRRLRIAGVQMTMTPRLRKLVLTAHVTASVGSLGAVTVFLALAVAGLTSQDAQMVRAAYLAMDFTARLLIVTLLFAALLIGLVQSLGTTPWGLFRHYWVLTKFLLTVATIVVLLLQMDGIGSVAAAAADAAISSADLRGLRTSIRTHAAGGLVVLLVLVALSIYKPKGVTRYGWRKQHERR